MVHQVGLIPQVNLVRFRHYWNLESSTEDENLLDPHHQTNYILCPVVRVRGRFRIAIWVSESSSGF